MWKRLWLIPVLCLLPATAAAQKIVVLHGPFELVWDEKASPEKAQMVADAVSAAAKKVSEQWSVEQINEECKDKACLVQAVTQAQADEAVSVSTVQTGARYEFRIFLARGEGIVGEKTGAFSEALDELGKLIAKALGPVEQKLVKQDSHETEPAQEPEQQPLEEDDERDGPSPVAFWVSLGITGALAISWGIAEGVGYARYKELEKGDQDGDWHDVRDRAISLQVASRVLLGLTVAGAVTTGVLAKFTDFKSKKSSKKGATLRVPKLAPSYTAGGGMLVVEGRF